MRLISIPEEVELLKNLLSDPDDWISARILRLHDEHQAKNEANSAAGEGSRLTRRKAQPDFAITAFKSSRALNRRGETIASQGKSYD